MEDLLHIACQSGLGTRLVHWVLVPLLVVFLIRACIAALDEGLELRNKWLKRTR